MTSNQKLVKNFSIASASLLTLSSLAHPSFAQSEELKELTRKLVGSAFNDHSSKVAPLGVINQNTGRVQPVVNNLVDNYANKTPQFSQHFGNKNERIVELLVPIKTGLEFSLLQNKYPNIKVQQSPTGVAILAGSNEKALPMYYLGKKIQKEFGYSFELAYSDGHPDLNLAWLTPDSSGPVALAKKKQSLLAKTPVNTFIKPIFSTKASDLGENLTLSAPWKLNNEAVTKTIANTHKNIEIKGFKKSYKLSTQHIANNFPQLIAPPPVNVTKQNKRPNIIAKTSNPYKNSDGLLSPSKPTRRLSTRNLIAAVKINPVHLKNIQIGNSNLTATNKRLNYVYVQVANNSDIAKLNKSSGSVKVLRSKNNMLLARVGIFSNTKIGNRLKETKLNQLQAAGLKTIAYNAKTV